MSKTVSIRAVLLVFSVMVAVACTGEAEPTTTAAPVLTTTTPEATTTAAPTTTIADACRDTFCVRYNIRPEAAWADGTPVTAEDFVFTYETIVDPVARDRHPGGVPVDHRLRGRR